MLQTKYDSCICNYQLLSETISHKSISIENNFMEQKFPLLYNNFEGF